MLDSEPGGLEGSEPIEAAAGIKVAALTHDSNSSCGITAAGLTYCWGSGGAALGQGFFVNHSIEAPRLVVGSHSFAYVDQANRTTCALELDGTGYCWGASSTIGDGEPRSGATYSPKMGLLNPR